MPSYKKDLFLQIYVLSLGEKMFNYSPYVTSYFLFASYCFHLIEILLYTFDQKDKLPIFSSVKEHDNSLGLTDHQFFSSCRI